MFGKRLNKNALEAPPIAAANPKSVEVLRVWAAPGESQQVMLRPTWADAGAWGLLLADVARHAAQAYANEGRDPTAVIGRIKELFDAEWLTPTDTPQEITKR